jgi:hypothetical protein
MAIVKLQDGLQRLIGKTIASIEVCEASGVLTIGFSDGERLDLPLAASRD